LKLGWNKKVKLTVREYATIFKISTTAVYKKIENSLLNTVKEGNKTFIILDDLEDIKKIDEANNPLKPLDSNLKVMKKSFKLISKSLKEELELSRKVNIRLEKQLKKKDRIIQKLLTRNEELLNQVLNESQQTKEVYRELTSYLLPLKSKPQSFQEEEITEVKVKKKKSNKKKKK
jgi:hypothetical protein